MARIEVSALQGTGCSKTRLTANLALKPWPGGGNLNCLKLSVGDGDTVVISWVDRDLLHQLARKLEEIGNQIESAWQAEVAERRKDGE